MPRFSEKVSPRLAAYDKNVISTKNFNQNCQFMESFASNKPQQSRDLKARLSMEKQAIEFKLFMTMIDNEQSAATRKQQKLELKCRLWVRKGVLEHGFSKNLLESIALKHKKIGSPPKGYYYPELYMASAPKV